MHYTVQQFDFRKLRRADIEDFRDWLLVDAPRKEKYAKRTKGLSPKTVKDHIDFLSGFYKFADLPNPCRNVKRPKKSEEERQGQLEYFTEDELQRLLDVCAANHPTFLNGLLVLIHTGCRIAEVQGLRPEDLDRRRQTIRVVGKGRKPRRLTLSGPMQPGWEAIIAEMNLQPRADGFVFPQYSSWARKALERLNQSAFQGAIRCNPHKFRHTWATMALSGWDDPWTIVDVAEWLGHNDVSTTFKIYKHLLPKKPRSGYDLTAPETVQGGTKKNSQPPTAGNSGLKWSGRLDLKR